MSKVFIETSVFIRFLTQDNKAKYEDCLRLFKLVFLGKIRPYISNIVLLEIIFILLRQYKFAKTKVLQAIGKLLELRNLVLIERTDSKKALSLFKKHPIKYGDSLIAVQIPDGVTLISYDSDFAKIKSLSVFTPDEFIKKELENEAEMKE